MRSPTQSHLSYDEIRRLITAQTIGAHLVLREEVDSTNALAATLAKQGAPHGTVVIAETQTHGRGRLGRTWISPSGTNLYVSILLQRPSVAALVTWLPLLTALAVRRSVLEVTGLVTTLKWPNDVVIHRNGSLRKLAGVLAESTDQMVVIGMGLNVNMRAEDFPEDLRLTATSLLLEIGQPVDRARLLSEMLGAAEQAYNDLLHRPEKVMAEYRDVCHTLGKRVQIDLIGQDPLEGLAETIAPDGALCLRRADGRLIEIRAGDVVHLR